MERLGDVVRRELGRFGPPGAIADVVAVWAEAVGPGIARNAWPARIGRDGTLHAATSSSTWAFELAQLAPDILDRLRAALGTEVVGRLRFAPGKLPEPEVDPAEEDVANALRPSERSVAEAERLAASVEDPELRAAVARAAAASLERAAADRPF